MSRPELHPATKGFGLAADVYERGRPDYPAAAVRRLAQRLELRPGRTVLDLAAGTGKLTRLLVPTGANVLACEPIREMRDELERRVPTAIAMGGTAEGIPLVDQYVDAVTVAQAFHWFQADQALREMHRVLRPGGGLALIWNTRDDRNQLNAAITEILEPISRDIPRRRQRDARAILDESGLFTKCETALFKHRQKLDEEGLVERVLSISFVASATRTVRAGVEERVRALAHERDGRIRLPYVTEVYLAFRA
ncbi:MAG TPA: methyltransferase domain-containing protein [Gaiellaceae bacterium]|nr:methyltransferase domain-containing protein [Gaiellaceae bacterium]